MTIYTLRRFEVLPSRIERFKAAFHSSEGLWSEIARSLPGHIVTHLIQHDENGTKFLALSFWASREFCRNAYASPAISEFNHWLDCQTVAWADIALMNSLPGEEALAAV
jgi:heme-degrading monooxygenase HmoA